MRLLLASALIASAPLLAHAQSTCTSDGQSQPVALVERFINADCARCWAESTTHIPGPSALLVDWIVPSAAQGDEAPLSAAATRDALERLQQLGRPVPAATDTHVSEVATPASAPASGRLRVMVGPAVNDYRGTSISLGRDARRAMPAAEYRYTLLLVESIPAGTEGATAPRHLVRNMLQGPWNERMQLPKEEQWLWKESRSMRLPDGADASRTRVVGWLEDAAGQAVAAAQSVCPAPQ
ncbi:hypothetical protein [Acidovorax sp. FG27]|uniref:hypothetical protein n=1 Tax=Acidovorax sp. FG27 TaxID=3133652 RepID=UPI0030EA07EB